LTWKTIVGRKAVDSSLHVEANVEASASVTHTLMRMSRRMILIIINEDDPFNITDDPISTDDDDAELLADQRTPIHCNLSVNCINRTVLVGMSIKPDSNAS